MTQTPDRFPGLLQEEGILLDPAAAAPTQAGEIRYYSGAFQLRDGAGTYNPRTGGPHATTHHKGGSDELIVQLLASGGTTPSGKSLQSDGANGWSLVDYVPGYPAALEYSSSDILSTTTSSTFQVKHSHVTADLSLGHYLIFAQGVLSGTANNTETEGRIMLDGTTTVQSVSARLSRVNAEFPMVTLYVLDDFSGVHTFTIEYRKSGGSGSSTIRDARVILWRIS